MTKFEEIVKRHEGDDQKFLVGLCVKMHKDRGELIAMIEQVSLLQRYVAETFVPSTQIVQFTSQPDGDVVLHADIQAILDRI